MYYRRETGYVAFMRRQPWPLRLLIVSAVIVSIYWLLEDAYRYFGGLLLLFWAFFPDLLFNNSPQLDKVKNLPGMLDRKATAQGDMLRFGMEEAPISSIRKVAISKYDDEFGFIDFPYTSKLTRPMLFPLQQIDSVRHWFAENTPELEVIE